jgi:hypothetical protein
LTFPQWFRCSALAILVTTVTGCYTWQPYDIGATPAASHALPDSLRITRHDSSRVALNAPFVRADTLFGFHHGDTVAVSFADIADLQRLRFSTGRTVVLALAPAAAFGLTYLIVCGEGLCESDF